MGESKRILQRQKNRVFFSDEDTDVFFNWMLGVGTIAGLSHGELFAIAQKIGKKGNPATWQHMFREHGRWLVDDVSKNAALYSDLTAANQHLAAANSYRAAIQFTDPQGSEYDSLVMNMEESFQKGAMVMCNGMIEPIEVPYQQTSLSGYYMHAGDTCPTLFVIGGGDTYREDLFYFAGYVGWRRGYNILMVDLPGQGKMPSRDLVFTAKAGEAISMCIDWLAKRNPQLQDLAVYGLSGGGYFTAQAVERDARITAWIASTPIYDMAELFRREMGVALKTPGWIMKSLVNITGHMNESMQIGYNKYAWQFGTTDFKAAINKVLEQAVIVDYSKIGCPALFFVGASEGSELRRQAQFLCDKLSATHEVALKEFDMESGADAHSQINNMRLAQAVVFDWLDTTFHRG